MNKDVFRTLRQMLMEELDLSRELSDKEILDVIDDVDTFSCNLTFVTSTTILMVVYLHALDSIVRLLDHVYQMDKVKYTKYIISFN